MNERQPTRRPRLSVGVRLAHYLGAAAVLGIAVLLWFVGAFIVEFELLGPAVRDNSHGWLGPPPRKSTCMQDIGKVNYWACEDITLFTRHELGCRLWLTLNGIRPGPP
jgi:hypothetical protein